MKFKEKSEVWIVKMWMLCIWYDCSLKITSTIVWVCHTHVFPCFAEFQENQLKLICLVLGVWGEKGEFSHCMSAWETSIKNTGSSRNIMKGIITFKLHVVFLKWTNSQPTEFPCTIFPEQKKRKSPPARQSHKFCYIQHLWNKKIQCNWCIINPSTTWNCKIICKQETDA